MQCQPPCHRSLEPFSKILVSEILSLCLATIPKLANPTPNKRSVKGSGSGIEGDVVCSCDCPDVCKCPSPEIGFVWAFASAITNEASSTIKNVRVQNRVARVREIVVFLFERPTSFISPRLSSVLNGVWLKPAINVNPVYPLLHHPSFYPTFVERQALLQRARFRRAAA